MIKKIMIQYLSIGLLMLPGLANAAVFNVNSLEDVVDDNLGDTDCAATVTGGGTACTLRAAIQNANQNGESDTINLTIVGDYAIAIGPGAENQETGLDDSVGDFDIFEVNSLTINGISPAETAISGANMDRVLHMEGNGVIVTLNNLTIKDGLLPLDAGLFLSGAGIYAFDQVDLTIDNVEIINNRNDDHVGGGGAFINVDFNISNSLIANNTCEVHGGGLSLLGTGTIENTTVSGNQAGDDTNESGGGLTSSAGVSIFYSTITNNVAAGVGGIAGEVSIKNSIVAGNNPNDTNQINADISTQMQSGGYNIIGVTASTEESVEDNFNFLDTDQYGLTGSRLDPRLSTLTTTNSPTAYHLPLSISPALDAADPADCIATDQRGESRPFNGRCDIGAVERGAICGNNNPEEDEVCDEGQANGSLDSTCSSLCTSKTQGSPDILCGNGQIDSQHEVCDNGSENGTEDNNCTTNCQLVTDNGGGNGGGNNTTGGGCNLNKQNSPAYHWLLLGLLIITYSAVRTNYFKRNH